MENSVVKIPSTIGDWMVDFELNTIRFVEDPTITVPLAHRFSGNSGYVFRLDLEKGCLSEGEDAIEVTVPLLLHANEQSRREFVKQYDLEGIDLDGLTDEEAKKLQPALKERMQMDEVTIDIAGKMYTVDYYQDAFVPKESALPSIAFQDVKRFYDRTTDTCLFLIDKRTRAYSVDIRDGLLAVQTPHPFRLDPMRLGLCYDLDIYEKVMDQGPLKNHHIAKTIYAGCSEEQQLTPSNRRARGHRR